MTEDKSRKIHHVIHMRFRNQLEYVAGKIRMHVKRIPQSAYPEMYIDLLDEFIDFLGEMSETWIDKSEVTQATLIYAMISIATYRKQSQRDSLFCKFRLSQNI